MANTTASAGRDVEVKPGFSQAKEAIGASIARLSGWLERNDYKGYDTFDGLNAKYVRPLTFETRLLRIVLQQGVRRFPINLRPLLGVEKSHSSKGMGFLARGFMRMNQATGDPVWNQKAEMALQWLNDNQCKGYRGACWGNHFDYQSRSSYTTKDIPSVVWTALIGHAFLDAYEHFQRDSFLETAVSACEHIIHDLRAHVDGDTHCIHYFPTSTHQVHNANTLGGSFLARTASFTGNQEFKEFGEKSIRYTAKYQKPNGSWDYGEMSNLRWVDNFHTAYVLDSFKYFVESAGDLRFDGQMMKGYEYWKNTFFGADGTPRYYNHKTEPLDIQCGSQAIDTLLFFQDRDPSSLELAIKVADWTIKNMQDSSGYFYYRRYSPWVVNKTPTLHWGQSTMMCALAGLYNSI